MSLQVVIVGGGIGGMAAALALSQRGHRVDVLEQASAFAEFGAGIQLGPNVVRRLRGLGVEDAVLKCAARPAHLGVYGAVRGEELARMPFDAARTARYGAPYLCIHRADLHTCLHQALQLARDDNFAPGSVALRTGVQVTRIATRGGERVCAATGTHAWEADGLVGADGVWGQTRAQLFEDDPPPHRTGHTAWRALIAQSTLPSHLRSDCIRVWLGAQVHVVAYPVRAGDWLNVVVLAETEPEAATGRGDDARSWDQAAGLEALRRATAPVGAPALRQLLEAVPAWRAWSLHDRAPVSGPSEMAQERIALVGDAAHPMLPYLAQGAGMAIEDAVALADELVDIDGRRLPAAFSRYAQQRWVRNSRVQARARRNARIFHATGLIRLGRDISLRVGGARVLDVPWLYAG